MGKLKGQAVKSPKAKSETASDATNIFGLVRICRFNSIIARVIKFPANKTNSMSPKTPDSKMILEMFLDCSSSNISVSCFSVESIEVDVLNLEKKLSGGLLLFKDIPSNVCISCG